MPVAANGCFDRDCGRDTVLAGRERIKRLASCQKQAICERERIYRNGFSGDRNAGAVEMFW
ncbi:MAG: hypothetical protein ABI612_19820 [Betaproteobacteria bacterium]